MEETTKIVNQQSPEAIAENLLPGKDPVILADNMEVHHHPDIHHKKKKFGEYFLEFLMIFLAVTLGFFAESLREHLSDTDKEHEYMASFLNNLREDSVMMENAIAENQHKAAKPDSLILLSVSRPANAARNQLLHRYSAGSVSYYSVFRSNDATMLQLKNSGGLRIIKKAHMADSIAQYDNELKIIYAAETLYISATEAAATATQEILDYTIYSNTLYFKAGEFTGKTLQLLTEDPKQLKLFFNKIIYERGATVNYTRNIQTRLPFLKSLMQYLQTEYKLE